MTAIEQIEALIVEAMATDLYLMNFIYLLYWANK